MNLDSQIKEIKKNFSSQILFDENLSKYSWFNLGGPAKIIFKPKNLNELSLFLKKTNGLGTFILPNPFVFFFKKNKWIG